MEKRLNINGLEVLLKRKNIKNIYLRVTSPDCRVKVSAPYYVSYEFIETFVKKKFNWIIREIEKINSKKLKFVNGEFINLKGERFKILVKHSNKPRIEKNEKEIIFYFPDSYNYDKKIKFLDKWLKKEMEKEVKILIDKWENITKIKLNEVKIRKMRTKWGVCNIVKKKITLNLELIKKPLICLEYVFVHEFVHFFEKRHNQNFYKKLSYFFPHWREAERLIKC